MTTSRAACGVPNPDTQVTLPTPTRSCGRTVSATHRHGATEDASLGLERGVSGPLVPLPRRPAGPTGNRACRWRSVAPVRPARSLWVPCNGRSTERGLWSSSSVTVGPGRAGPPPRPPLPTVRSGAHHQDVDDVSVSDERSLDLFGEDLLAARIDRRRLSAEQLDQTVNAYTGSVARAPTSGVPRPPGTSHGSSSSSWR